MSEYQGKMGFIWFTGIVEDRNDPLFLNRVRVRIHGAHTHDKQKIATPDLPWSDVMMPTTSPSLSGLGTTTHGLVEGSSVMGFYRDNLNMSDPVIMGSFVGIPQKFYRVDETVDDNGNRRFDNITRTTTDGFNDPRLATAKDYEIPQGLTDEQKDYLVGRPHISSPDGKTPQHIIRSYGLTLALDKSPRRSGETTGELYPKTSYIADSDVNKLARPVDESANLDALVKAYGDQAKNVLIKDTYPNNVIETNFGEEDTATLFGLGSPIKAGLGKTLFRAPNTGGDNEDRLSWVKPKYPFNHVYESESGHVIEIDDTPDYERINVFHRTGSRIEINNKGEIHIIAAPGQDINLQGANVNINNEGSGNLNIKALGEAFITAVKKTKIVSEGPTDIISSGETKITALKDVIMKAVKKIKIQ